MSALASAGDITSILSFGALVVGYGIGRRQSIAHLRAHLEVLSVWAAGPSGSGWDKSELRPVDELLWRNPAWNVVTNESGGGVSQLTMGSSFLLPLELTPVIVRTAQSVASFNQALSRYEAFKLADIALMISTQDKLTGAYKKVFAGATLPRSDTTLDERDTALRLAKLTGGEEAYSAMLFKMMGTLHWETIGTPSGKGLCRHVSDLTESLQRHGL